MLNSLKDKTMPQVKKTKRGFSISNFKDNRNNECSIQKSSNAEKECIWLGADKINLQEFKAGQGWTHRSEVDEFSMDHHFVANNRMELTRKQVAKLLPILHKFVETGDL
jgi:hypothetical protein